MTRDIYRGLGERKRCQEPFVKRFLTPFTCSGQFAKWDTDGDQSISLAELAVQLHAAFSAGTPRVNGPFGVAARPAPFVQAARPAPGAVPGGDAVPSWFTKMDRNRDGDLSPKEFLGGRPLFDKFDKDRDGLISAQEAIEGWKKAAEKR